jgi:hypothetical protein
LAGFDAVPAHASSQLGLAVASNLDGLHQGRNIGRNVLSLRHARESSTRILVHANKESGLAAVPEPCTVLTMPNTKRKPVPLPAAQPKKKRAAEQEPGPDGLTLAQRLIRLMNEREVSQTELARMCSQYYSAFVSGADDKVKQQHIFNIIQGQASSWALPLIAAVFEVNEMWLQFGIGAKERKTKN